MPGTPPAPESGGVLPGGKGIPAASKDVSPGGDEAASSRRDGGAAIAGTGAGPAGGDRAELERFRTEAAQLRGQGSGNKRQRSGGWRMPVATLLIVVGCLLTPVSVLAVWTANQVSDTDRYVANIEPLIHDPAIQNALTDKITAQIITYLNVVGHANQAAAELTSRGLPRVGTMVNTFAAQVAGAIAGFVHTQVHKIVTSPAAAHLWVQANRAAHEQIVQALSGQGGGAISTSNGQVVLDLAPFLNVVKQDLVNRGFSLIGKLPAIHVTIALFSSRTLVEAQTLYRLLNDLKWVLPILALVLIGLGVYIARDHRRALIGAGLGLAASMVVLGALLAIFRGIYLNSVPASILPADAAAAAFDTLARFIKQGLRVLLVAGLVVAVGAYFTGPSATAVRTRGALVSGLGRLRATGEHAGLRTGPAGRWTYQHRAGLRVTAVALVGLIFVFWGQPTGLTVLVLAIVLLVLLGLIELIGKPPAQPQMADHADGGT